jgi:predicted ABC-type ATPase
VTSPFDSRPIIVALAGPNGAGKSTFYEAHLRPVGLRFVNPDELSRELGVDAYQAAEVAGQLRRALVEQRESFVFETVFSDPVGDKLDFLKQAAKKGYTVVLVFIGLDGPGLSQERVAMRVLQGGHDVPTEKLQARYPRTMENLAKAVKELGHVIVFDNSDMRRPFRRVAAFELGKMVEKQAPLPRWLLRVR